MKTSARSFRFFRFAAGFFTDFLLIFSGLVFDFPFLLVFPPTAVFIIPAIIGIPVLRRYQRFKSSKIVSAAFFILLIFSLDVIVLMHFAIYGWHTLLLLPAPISYIIALVVRKHPILNWSPAQALVVPLIVTFLLSTAADSPQSPGDCAKISGQPGIRLLHKFPNKTRARFVMQPEGSENLLVSFRKGFTVPQPNYIPRTLQSINPRSGKAVSWLDDGEVIGLYQRPDNRQILAVTILPAPDKKRARATSTSLSSRQRENCCAASPCRTRAPTITPRTSFRGSAISSSSWKAISSRTTPARKK